MLPRGLSWGQQSIFKKFLYTSRFENTAKCNEGMIVALIERDNIGGPAQEIDHLKDLHVLVLNKLTGKLGTDYIKAINYHLVKFRESVLQIFNTRETTDVVANTVVEKVFDTNCCNVLSMTRYSFC